MEVQLVDEQVKVPKELNDVRIAIAGLVKSIKKAKADGFDLAIDVPEVVMASYKNVVHAIEGVDKVPMEIRKELGASIVCAGLMGADVLEALK